MSDLLVLSGNVKPKPRIVGIVATLAWVASMLGLALIFSLPSVLADYPPTGDGVWFWQNPAPQGNTLNGIACPDVITCYALGDAGTILRTVDGGNNWTNQYGTPTPGLTIGTQFNRVSCLLSTTCVAVGNLGLIINTGSSGATWNLQTLPSNINYYGLACISGSLTCYAVGTEGTILKSTDRGDNWSNPVTGAAPPVTDTLNAVACTTDTTCLVAGGKPFTSRELWYTTNGGASWTEVSLGGSTSSFFQDATCISGSTICYAVGDFGQLAYTPSLASGSWNLDTSTGFTNYFKGVSCLSTSNCVLVGSGGVLYTGSVGIWTQQFSTLNNSLSLNGISCIAGAITCYGVATDGRIIKGNGTTTWQNITQGWVIDSFNSISCPNTINCLAVGAFRNSGITYGLVYTTSVNASGLVSLTEMAYGVPISNQNSISCVNSTPLACVSVGESSRTYRITNDGTTLSPPSIPISGTDPAPPDLKGVSCATASTCYAVGGSIIPPKGARIFKTTNGGTSWSTQFSSRPEEELNGVDCPTVTTCFAAGGTYSGGVMTVIRTTNGLTWSTVLTRSLNSSEYNAIACPSETTCYAVGGAVNGMAGQIEATFDGGVSWVSQVISYPLTSFNSVSCLTVATCFAAGRNGVILATTTGGASWYPLQSGTTSDLSEISCPVGCTVVGAGGAVLTNSRYVTNPDDDNSDTPGTLSYALANARNGQAIVLKSPNGVVTLANPVFSNHDLKAGVVLGAMCDPGGPTQVINNKGIPGLLNQFRLNGNNTLIGVHFSQMRGSITTLFTGNSLACLKVTHE